MISAPLGSVIGGKYRLDSLLHQGEVTDVFAARHVERDVPCVMKLARDASSATVARLTDEARVLALAKNPYVCRCFDLGKTHEGVPFILLDYFHGEPLHLLLTREGTLSTLAALQVFWQILTGLSAFHAAKMIHGAVHGGNVLVSPRANGALDVKIIDGSSAVKDGDPAIDRRAAGALLAFALVGTTTSDPTRLREKRPDLPAEMSGVIRDALATDAKAFTSVIEFRDALTRCLLLEI
jgi:serine/threonine protein kinase